ncbi:SDR family oxidoreductase [Pelagibacterium limicola]|uniref:SDR family oxidoreductase n=1 Tax=Pelagibacterium limicola TaxID=2791022 RepID=UPI0018AF76F4|nr:SDR family oxidoreductase [Pelagibacterium limicola]
MASDVILITGGTRGIGAAIARRVAGTGSAVAVTYGRDEAAAVETLAALKATGVPALAIRNRAEDASACAALWDEVDSALGPVTALVNNAGITGRICTFDALEPEVMAEVVAVNLLSPMLLSQVAIRRWLADGTRGRIVNISSVAARLGAPNEYIPYAATKAGIETFTLGLAREVARHGIRVNAVAPGITSTSIHAAGGEPDRVSRVAPAIPMGRAAEPEEIAEAVLWLLGDEAGYVTGETITVSGGR